MTTRASAPPLTEDTVRGLSQGRGEPAWLRDRRLYAWRAFEAMAMPDPLDEAWRRTDISGLDLAGALETPPETRRRAPRPPAALRDRRDIGGLLVQRDDAIVEHYVGPEAARGLVFMDLQSAAGAQPKLVEPRLHSLVQTTEWKLQALQAALWQGGGFLYVPRGVEVTLPLHYVLTMSQRRLFPHLLIVAEAGSSVTIVQETWSAAGDVQALVSGAVEVFAGPDARVRFLDIQRWGRSTYAFTTVRARLERGAELSAGLVGLGARLARTKLEVSLLGEGAGADLLGVTFGEADQHFDYATLQDHVAPRTRSDLVFKAALDDRSSMVWNGAVRIQKGASQSDAGQTSRNLLLSDKAKAAPIPVLEIEAYDVLRCSHAAAAGPLDEEQRFYLESRGIPAAEAERLLVEAFFQEVLDRLPAPASRPRIEKALAARIARSA